MRRALLTFVLPLTAALAQAKPAVFVAIEGRIVDVLGDVIPAAAVRAIAAAREVGHTTADGEGIYRISLPASGAELHVTAPGKVTARLAWRGLVTSRVRNVVLEDGARFSGKVQDELGHPIEGAIVVIAVPGVTSLTTTSDAAGAYAFTGVPLRAVMGRATTVTSWGEFSRRVMADCVQDITLPSQGRAACLVRVRELAGEQAADTHVRVFGPDLAAVQNDGRVTLRPDGTAPLALRSVCVIEATLKGFVLSPGDRMVGPGAPFADFNVTGAHDAEKGTLLTGRVRTLTNRIVSGLTLVARDRSRCELGSTIVDRDGTFRLRVVLPPDRFCRMGLALGEWLLIDDDRTIVDGCSWAATSNPTESIDLLVERTGAVKSMLRGPAGVQFALADVVVADCEFAHRPLLQTTTDRAGRIDFGLPPGNYELMAIAHDGQVCGAEMRVAAGQVHAPQWQPVPTGEVVGILRDHTGQPMPGVELVLNTEANGDVRATARHMSRILTDRAGRFRCRGLPIGPWWINGVADARVDSTPVDVVVNKSVTAMVAYRQ